MNSIKRFYTEGFILGKSEASRLDWEQKNMQSGDFSNKCLKLDINLERLLFA